MANVALEVVLVFPVPMAFSVYRVQEEAWVSQALWALEGALASALKPGAVPYWQARPVQG